MSEQRTTYQLSSEQLSAHYNETELPFDSLDELESSVDFLGQTRAKAALGFGLEASRSGYNLFVMGESGTGRISMVMRQLEAKAQVSEPQPDWVYVNNFDEPREPWAVQLPASFGKQLVQDCQSMVRKLMVTIPASFENPSYQRKKTAIEREFNMRFETALDEMEKQANALNFALFQDASNVSFSPLKDGKAIDDIQFAGLPAEEKEEINQAISLLEDKLSEALLEMPRWKRESYEKQQELYSETIQAAIQDLVQELEDNYRGLTGAQIYFKELSSYLVKTILENFHLIESPELKNSLELRELLQQNFVPNLLITNNPALGAPVVYEAHPTYANLFGRVEYWNEAGALTTSYQFIRAGALHRANGGYLILEAEKLFEDPYIWEQLKRTLQTQELKLEPPTAEGQSAVSIGLNPHAIPLDVKIILVGHRHHYYLLQDMDTEFSELFRVLVDFDDQTKRSTDNITQLARLIKTHAESEGFAPVDLSAFREIVTFSSRLCENQKLLSLRFGEVFELIGEAEVIRAQKRDTTISNKHVTSALLQREYRHSRMHSDMLREVIDGQILILTDGDVIGSINGLTVWEIGSTQFGTPARITATVFPGAKGIVDIERESDLGLSVHSKGVLILSGYLSNRYAREFALTISANIVMEQSYGLIDGDSASLAELCALISAITEKPIRQSLAVTGSINQFGEVQAIGGVNEKIEGFYQLCKARGLTGTQGVIIPKANQQHLMLKKEVIDSVRQNQFAIYTVETVDQALEILCLDNRDQLKEMHTKITEALKELHDICEGAEEEEEENAEATDKDKSNKSEEETKAAENSSDKKE
ncbi:Lon protease family protein [Pleionea sp. CnH1-48]|uniref:Lon protease family protein n=1 Tax=Pleionea sp. CnH1-48 TaxID=2954494 RepID=UPI002096A1FD|nr:ATP-binding protein [Pleionea sp. CnH1-48]MCO7226413.1 AAA family ATPase [Pleionea sp. CnH1-48]